MYMCTLYILTKYKYQISLCVGDKIHHCLNIISSSFTSHKNQNSERTDRAYHFLPLSKKIRMSKHCRYHNKGSTFSSVTLRPWVLAQPRFEPSTCHLADQHLSNNWPPAGGKPLYPLGGYRQVPPGWTVNIFVFKIRWVYDGSGGKQLVREKKWFILKTFNFVHQVTSDG